VTRKLNVLRKTSWRLPPQRARLPKPKESI